MWPNLGEIEGVVAGLLGIKLRHDLHKELPLGEFSLFNRVVEIFLCALSRLPNHPRRFGIGEMAVSLLGLEVKLDPETFAAVVPETIGMGAVPVHEAVALRNASVTEESCDLM